VLNAREALWRKRPGQPGWGAYTIDEAQDRQVCRYEIGEAVLAA
jgi:hypothetical protein